MLCGTGGFSARRGGEFAARRAAIRPGFFAAGFFLVFLGLESLFPLRRRTQALLPRLAANLSIGGVGALFTRLAAYPLLLALAARADRSGWGLLAMVPAGPLRAALAFALQDYVLYAWHAANHLVPFFWRFHQVHHVDLDLDVSTGSRFYVGELFFSAFLRAAEILLLGLAPVQILFYDSVSLIAVFFHHSNVRLPGKWDARLNRLVVTPGMHGIHHSIVRRETDSNFSTVFSFWDRLHRTFRAGVPPDAITMGVPSCRDARATRFWPASLLPFRPTAAWRLPDGTVPGRP